MQVKKYTFGEECSATKLCDDTLLLACSVNFYCDCPNTLFWNGTYCGKFKFITKV